MNEKRRDFAPNRRRALQLLSAGIAAAMTRCGEPQEEIVPYVDMPERTAEGEIRHYATALPLAGYGRGVLGVTVDGRPIKIEGNPRHPYSLGATDLFAEGEILSLYDPDRSRAPAKDGVVASWQEFATEWAHSLQIAAHGAGTALVTGRITSPTLLRLLALIKSQFPELRHYRYEPVNDDQARAGSRLAFGRVLESVPRLDETDVIVSLDADPFGPGPQQIRNAMGFSRRRRNGPPQRIYAAESGWTLTGAMADHRIAVTPGQITEIARALLNAGGGNADNNGLSEEARRFTDAVTSDLQTGRGLILAGETQSASVHAAAHFLNGRFRAPVDLVASSDPVEQEHGASLRSLLADIAAHRIRSLIVFDANPVYDSGDSEIGDAISAIPFTAHIGCYSDETAERCRWHLPLSHSLESWGDIRSPDSAVALIQPLIRPLYDTRSGAEVLNLLAGGASAAPRELVRATWQNLGLDAFDKWWTQTLTAGIVPNTAAMPIAVTAVMPVMPRQSAAQGFEIVLAPSPAVWDGRYANNAWLLECPAPFTKEVWGNAIHFSPEDAARFGLVDGDSVTLRSGSKQVDGTTSVVPGQSVGVARGLIGFGRWRAGSIGSGVGVQLQALTGGGSATPVVPVTVLRNPNRAQFHTTQAHTRLEGSDKDLFPLAPAAELPHRLAQLKPDRGGIVPPAVRDQYAWAMVIDNDVCIGCNACVIACQAENNVGVVGPDQIDLGRDMHWLRIDAYQIDEGAELRRGFQPVPCMHCETAPCEPVCPVAASVHDHEGLNVQVYNRCIGTRFCEANCPYKVRRFNFFGYTRGQEYGNLGETPVRAQRNPNVSVRGRGVMEKCTYCVQRISAARREAEKEDRVIREGEVVTACAAACPTRAIYFGNRNDPESAVAKLQRDPRHFSLLEHLDTRPRTTYLGKTYNPSDQMKGQPA